MGASAVPGERAPGMPDGVRLQLTLPPGQALSGVLTRDWARPGMGGNP
jgi:general secretion pathway protein J